MQIIEKKVIIFVQSDLQNLIAQEIAKKYETDDILILNIQQYKFTFANRNYFIKLYGFVNIIKTFFVFRNNGIKFKCDLLIGNLLTNFNSFFIISTFDYSKLILIDDGIGTPVILKHPDYYSSQLKYRIKNILLKIIYPFFFKEKFKIIKDFLPDISFYFTIYDFNNDIPSKKIKIFNESTKILYGHKCFIGQPMIEFALISKEKYIGFLNDIIRREGNIIYYGHPSESVLQKVDINGLIYVENRLPIEKEFEENGIPEYVYSFYSSSLLNLKQQNPRVNFYYIPNNFSISSPSIFASYRTFLELADIKEYPLSLLD